jgi:hypothetical protein
MPEPARALARETIAPDERSVTAEFIAFLEQVSASRHPTGQIPRFNQGRHSGCVEAEFTVVGGLDGALAIGLFQRPQTYAAWIRFANASSASDREKDVRGMAIKLRGVAGENLTAGESTQDFVLNSHPVMMVPGTREFLELLRASEAKGLRMAKYFLTHPRAARIAFESRQHHVSHLDIPYWSATPYLFGAGRAVKYIVRPAARVRWSKPALSDTYLHDELRRRLSTDEVSFDFFVQFQRTVESTPIEDASIEWKERDSPYVRVAEIHVPRQNIDVPGRELACERISFNPWHCLAEHRPLGSMNRARREIYKAMSKLRASRSANL